MTVLKTDFLSAKTVEAEEVAYLVENAGVTADEAIALYGEYGRDRKALLEAARLIRRDR